MHLRTIPLNQTLDRVQEWLPHFIALAHRRPAQALWQAIHEGRITIHLVCDDTGQSVAAIGTRVLEHETGTFGELTWCGGKNIPAILDVLPTLEQELKRQGCQRIALTGREGWSRVLRPLGYRKTQITMEKAITNV